MLNVLITTPTNRFMKKKHPTMTKTMKKIIHMMLASLSGTGR